MVLGIWKKSNDDREWLDRTVTGWFLEGEEWQVHWKRTTYVTDTSYIWLDICGGSDAYIAGSDIGIKKNGKHNSRYGAILYKQLIFFWKKGDLYWLPIFHTWFYIHQQVSFPLCHPCHQPQGNLGLCCHIGQHLPLQVVFLQYPT